MRDHSPLEPGELLMAQERERFLARLLHGQGFETLADLKGFEAGSRTGYNLRLLVQWGASPGNVAGQVDTPAAAEQIQAYSQGIRVYASSAEAVPEPGEHFDLAMAFGLFSRVRDEDVARGIARELFRITRPGGLIVVYDVRRSNPRNRNTHSISAEDVRRWFPKCPLRTRSITLAPPIARPVAKYAPWLYGTLAALPLLRTHQMYVLRRPALPPIRDEIAPEIPAIRP